MNTLKEKMDQFLNKEKMDQFLNVNYANKKIMFSRRMTPSELKYLLKLDQETFLQVLSLLLKDTDNKLSSSIVMTIKKTSRMYLPVLKAPSVVQQMKFIKNSKGLFIPVFLSMSAVLIGTQNMGKNIRLFIQNRPDVSRMTLRSYSRKTFRNFFPEVDPTDVDPTKVDTFTYVMFAPRGIPRQKKERTAFVDMSQDMTVYERYHPTTQIIDQEKLDLKCSKHFPSLLNDEGNCKIEEVTMKTTTSVVVSESDVTNTTTSAWGIKW